MKKEVSEKLEKDGFYILDSPLESVSRVQSPTGNDVTIRVTCNNPLITKEVRVWIEELNIKIANLEVIK